MAYYMTMLKVDIAEAKDRMWELVRRVKAGETIIISERNVPVAELRPVQGESTRPMRSLEPVWPGWSVPESFFEPLPEELLRAFDGD
jgi:prevent-host-death family protein